MNALYPNQSGLRLNIHSRYLGREVVITVLLPAGYDESLPHRLLLFNDGQDFTSLNLADTFAGMQQQANFPLLIIAGMHANEQRIHEYGIAASADYAGRGAGAKATTSFVVKELLPLLREQYPIPATGNIYAGFSLGGLMALDVVWNNAGAFSAAGIFSGSLWWRQKAIDAGYQDSDRIMHAQIKSTVTSPQIKCWFQCGSHDEYDDRDHDGVIDSIQDTLECIAEMERKGFVWGKDVFYTEVKGGEHNPHTWGQVMPQFLEWLSKVI